MTSKVYFLDASALVHYYAPFPAKAESWLIRRRVERLHALALLPSTRVVLQLPNICLAECAGAFARLCFEAGAFGGEILAEDAFRRLWARLIEDVENTRVIHSYALRPVHFEGVDEIFRRDYTAPSPRKGRRLSAHDALILSMAREYRERHPHQRVAIVTNDRRISDFCRVNAADFPAALHLSAQNPD